MCFSVWSHCTINCKQDIQTRFLKKLESLRDKSSIVDSRARPNAVKEKKKMKKQTNYWKREMLLCCASFYQSRYHSLAKHVIRLINVTETFIKKACTISKIKMEDKIVQTNTSYSTFGSWKKLWNLDSKIDLLNLDYKEFHFINCM